MQRVILMLVSIMTLSAACEEATQDTGNAAEDEIRASINGDFLGETAIAADHTLTFWEFEPGVVAIRESYGVDSGQDSVLDPATIRPLSVTQIFEQLSDGKPAPRELTRAAERLSARREVIAADVDAPSDSGIVPYTADYYGDNYGAKWFLDRYCVEGGFRYCPTNTPSSYSGRTTSTWYKTCAMAADFEAEVKFRGGHRYYFEQWPWGGEWRTVLDWDYNVMARRVECWWYTGEGRRESWVTGLAPSPRAHFSVLRN